MFILGLYDLVTVVTFVIKVYCTSCVLYFSLRAKYHKLKYGTELNQGDMKPPSYDSGKHRFIRVLMFSRDEVIKASEPTRYCTFQCCS